MKKRLILAAFLFSALAAAALFAIVWGELDGDRHPNVGNIVYRLEDGGPLYPWASGSLIAEKVFLTAGHVTYWINYYISQGELDLKNVYVCFDSTDTLMPTANLHPISQVITHPGYPPAQHKEDWCDVGILVLEDAVTDLPLATLPSPKLLDQLKAAGKLKSGPEGTKFVCTGYGSFLEFPPPVIVYENNDRYMAKSGYLGLKKNWLVMNQNGPSGNGGTGYGDSGGPNFWVDEDGNEILVAVTSTGDPKAVATNIAYRVDTPEILNFIMGVMAATD
jgi:Trypsin